MSDAIPPTGAPAPTTTPVTSPAGAPASPPAAAGDAPDPSARIKELESQLAETRREAAGYRTQNKGELAEFKKQLAALGGASDPAQPSDPASILAQIQKERADEKQEIRRLKVDLALNDVYGKLGVKPKLTRALLESEGVLSGLNPDDAEFSKALHSAVKKLADETPELKSSATPTPTAPRSSAPFPGGNNAPAQLGLEDLKGMKPAEINAAREKGQLNQLLNRQ